MDIKQEKLEEILHRAQQAKSTAKAIEVIGAYVEAWEADLAIRKHVLSRGSGKLAFSFD